MKLLFTTKSCPNCPRAKKLLSEFTSDYETIDAGVPEGLQMAKGYQLKSVPSLVVVTNTKDFKVYSGLDSIQDFLTSQTC